MFVLVRTGEVFGMSMKVVVNRARTSVLRYDSKKARAAANQAIEEGLDVIEVINNGFAKGIREIGELYDKGLIYLPHLMAAAETMNAGIETLLPEIKKSQSKLDSCGNFVICSVEGDIHSIGKDICAALLTAAGFTVFNLGRDVPVSDIIDAVKEHDAVIVGTSALMESTMVRQEELEKRMIKECLKGKCGTNIGGAPISQRWAEEIGADFYSKSASECVAKAKAYIESRNKD